MGPSLRTESGDVSREALAREVDSAPGSSSFGAAGPAGRKRAPVLESPHAIPSLRGRRRVFGVDHRLSLARRRHPSPYCLPPLRGSRWRAAALPLLVTLGICWGAFALLSWARIPPTGHPANIGAFFLGCAAPLRRG